MIIGCFNLWFSYTRFFSGHLITPSPHLMAWHHSKRGMGFSLTIFSSGSKISCNLKWRSVDGCIVVILCGITCNQHFYSRHLLLQFEGHHHQEIVAIDDQHCTSSPKLLGKSAPVSLGILNLIASGNMTYSTKHQLPSLTMLNHH